MGTKLSLLPSFGAADAQKMRALRILAGKAARRGPYRTLGSSGFRPRDVPIALLPSRRDVAAARRLTGKSYVRQGLERLALLLLHRMEPNAYYQYALFEPERFARAGEFITIRQTSSLLAHINASAPRQMTVDKRRFAAHCARHQIPTTRELCVIPPDAAPLEPSGELKDLASRDGVFMKPQSGEGSHGAGLLTYAKEGRWHFRATDMLLDGVSWEELCGHLRGHPQGGHDGYVVQERLRNHADLVPFGDSALHTVRILTIRRDGAVLPLTAALRLGGAGAVSDDFFRGAIAAPMDLETGALSNAVALEVASLPGSVRRAGAARAPLGGFIVPLHRELVALAVALHDSLPDFVALGHDVAVTPGGVVMLETNDNWAPEVVQKPADRGLGTYPDLLDALLAAAAQQPSGNQ